MIFSICFKEKFLLILLTFISLTTAQEMSDTLKQKGFVEINNTLISKTDYAKLYANFDAFIIAMTTHATLSAQVRKAEKDFLAQENQKKRYCGAPPSYRDPKVHPTKRFNKIYFQFIKEYYESIKTGSLQPVITEFLDDMQTIDATSKIYFNRILEELEITNPGIKKLMYGRHPELTVISKIVRYHKDPDHQWGTTPHFDKSALTLIWDSSDANHDSLIICDNPARPSIENLKKPQRRYAHQSDATSTLLISGLAFKKAGWNIKPTLHGVTSFEQEYRHAVISFLLIPDIDMSDLQTDYEIN